MSSRYVPLRRDDTERRWWAAVPWYLALIAALFVALVVFG